MQRVEWTEEYELGIDVIDGQHKSIVDYINKLADAGPDITSEQLAEVVDSLLDYTYSHFAFEEALMEEAGYENLIAHQKTHEAFTDRVKELHGRFCEGESVNEEMGELLKNWLLNHIKEDDRSYASLVKKNLSENGGHALTSVIRRFF
ncbi:MAG: bacteriohemerythrin [Gammaproteobacteria bacterium]|nr:bacteriohemerythrin [Gammaproteobacteria bacterium]